jgi:predicted amidophosphoribosyltransferase
MATAWVYGFKQRFKNAEDIRLILEATAAHFNCEGIIPVPPSTPDRQPNSLQRLFNTPIIRTSTAETRKYRHREAIPQNYNMTYDINLPKGKKFLLVDDIIRTGRTLHHFKSALSNMGVDSVPIALGIYYKLPVQINHTISIFSVKSEIDISLDEMMMDID